MSKPYRQLRRIISTQHSISNIEVLRHQFAFPQIIVHSLESFCLTTFELGHCFIKPQSISVHENEDCDSHFQSSGTIQLILLIQQFAIKICLKFCWQKRSNIFKSRGELECILQAPFDLRQRNTSDLRNWQGLQLIVLGNTFV
jgi:hypothetical protein